MTSPMPDSLRPGVQWITRIARKTPGSRLAIVLPTGSPYRDDLLYSPDGLLNHKQNSSQRSFWLSTVYQVRWPNGSVLSLYHPEEPDRLRGPQFHASWAYRIMDWPTLTPDASGLTALDNLRFATRLGRHPDILVTA